MKENVEELKAQKDPSTPIEETPRRSGKVYFPLYTGEYLKDQY